jgi:hypothetical protein
MSGDNLSETNIKTIQDNDFIPIFDGDPLGLVNEKMLNISLNYNFEPLKNILKTLIHLQDITKINLDDLKLENEHMKQIVLDYEEKFVYIEAKISKYEGKV